MTYSDNAQSKKTKILYLITQSESGGAQRYLFDLAVNLRSDFNIAVAFGEQGKAGELAKNLKQENIPYYTIPRLRRSISPFNDFLALIKIIKLIKKLKPDIIHLNSSKISILGSFAAFAIRRIGIYSRISVIYTVHGWVFNEPLSPIKKAFYKYAEKFTAYFKNKIICISKSDYEIAKTQLKIPEKKLSLIYHGINPINFLPQEEARQKLSQISNFQFPISNFVIGSIANLYRTKGLEYLIEATRLLIGLGFNVTTIIIGEGGERKNLENMIGQNNLRSKFFLAGKISNAAELLPAFDIYVSSSVKEGFPYNIMEAMRAGLPIVATNVGGTPEMITDKKNGLLADPQNPRLIAEKIKNLISDEELRKTLGYEARKTAQEKFIMDGMIQKTKNIYQKAAVNRH